MGVFNSVIDFPNFLMHILKIYLEKFPTGINEITFKEIPLDEKNFGVLLTMKTGTKKRL